MFDDGTTKLLESGCSLIVGTVSDDGEPYATRGWGLDVVDGDGGVVRLLLAAADREHHAHLADGGAIAVTAAEVPTLRALQLKGRSLGLEAATEDDQERAVRYCNDFFDDIVATDGTEKALLMRLIPAGYVVCRVKVSETFDQTPGPGAGVQLPSDGR